MLPLLYDLLIIRIPLEPRLFDDNLTLHRLHAIFGLVNAQSAEEEGGDEDAAELVYHEWVQVQVQ